MLPFILLFKNPRLGGWLAAVLLGLLLGSAARAQAQVAPPFMVRATPAGGTGLQVGQRQLLRAEAVYPAFVSAGLDGPVLATAVQADGKTLVGGRFKRCGTSTRQYLARLNADGTLDASFMLGTELDSTVYALAVQADGRIVVGGSFTTFGNAPCGGVARLLPTGALDASFNASAAPVSFSGRVRALAAQPGGGVLVGGEFASCGPTYSNSGYLVRLTSAGDFDSGFATNSHAGTGDFAPAVLALLVQSSSSGSAGAVVVGGSFVAPRQGLARLSSTGQPEANYPTSLTTGPTGGSIMALAEVGTGLAVGGDFGGYRSGTTPLPLPRLALLGSTGEPVAGFTPQFAAATSQRVSSLLVLPASSLLVVGGAFSQYAGNPRAYLVALDAASGAPNASFNDGATFNGPVLCLGQQPGLTSGNVVVGGAFTTYKGAPIRASRIARLLPTGRPNDLDVPVPGPVGYSWNTGQTTQSFLTSTTGLYWATATVGVPAQTSNTVALTVAAPTLAPITVAVTRATPPAVPAQLTAKAEFPALQVGTGFDDGKGSRYIWSFQTQTNGKLVVGGNFTTYRGAPRPYITRLHADGNVDPTFTQTGINDIVTLVSVQPDGKILVGGDFSSTNPTPGPDHLARLNTDGSLDTSFKGGFGNSPMGIAYQPDGKMLLAGNFQRYYTKGVPISNYTPVRYVVRLNTDGSLDTNFGPTSELGPNGLPGLYEYVTSIALQPDGKVLVGGDFTSYGPTLRQRVARLHPDGSLDLSFKPTGGNLNAPVEALALQPDGRVLVGGDFADHLVRLNADGTPDASFVPDRTIVNDIVTSLVLQPDGKVLVGGQFGGSIVRLNTDGSRDPTFAIAGAGFDAKVATLAVQADGQVLVGGAFANYNSTAGNRKGLARLSATGTLDDTNTPVPGTATYAWSNGSTGPTLWAAASGTYTATASFLNQTALSNAVTVTVNGTPADPTIPVTPLGPLSLCPGGSQALTAQVPNVPAGATPIYEWWQVSAAGGPPAFVGSGTLSTTGGSTTNTYMVDSNVAGRVPGQYYFTARTASSLAASATVSVGLPPSPVLAPPAAGGPVSGLPGTNIVLKGSNLEQVREVRFTTLSNPVSAVFTTSASATPELTVTVPLDAWPGSIAVLTACSATAASSVAFGFPPPAIAPGTPLAGAQGGSVLVTGSGFVAGATTATLNGQAVAITVVSGTQVLVAVPTSAAPGSGPLIITTPGGSASASLAVGVGTPLATTTIDAPGTTTLLAGSSYGNLVIKAPAVVVVSGTATNPVGLTVGRLEVQDGATLQLVDNAVVSGPAGGSFLLAAGATLAVGHPGGLGGAAGAGAIQLGSLFFSPDASYEYTGSQPQATGTNLPDRVRSLTSTNSSRLTLSQPVSVARVLTMAGAGHFFLDTKRLTLLSDATGTALAVNKAGAGRVLGTATVQRYINPVANTGTGFRYYGSPVKGATAAVLAAPAFDYDQSRYRLPVGQDTLPLISYGFTTSALVPNAPLAVGRGYRAVVPAATTVQFTGTLTTGDTTITLLRTGKEGYNGWNLVSNPYPAPLNWSKLVAAGGAVGLEAAIYVYESSGPNTGSYRCYVNNVSNDDLTNQTASGDLLIAMGQAFFVRVSKGRTSGTLTFRDAYRETSYGQQASFNRTSAKSFAISTTLERNGGSTACGKCNHHYQRATLYIDPAGATGPSQPFNPRLDADARNLFSFSQQTLSIRGSSTAGDSTLAIRAIATPVANQTVPLVISATAPGWYELQLVVQQASSLPLVPYLRDRTTAQLTSLAGATAAAPVVYPFQLSATEVLGTVINRFELVFLPAVLATNPARAGLGGVEVFPNPARQHIHVVVPAVPGATQVQATLFNAMGQAVLRQQAPLPVAGMALDLAASKLAGGVYILHIQAGSSLTTRRVVLDQ